MPGVVPSLGVVVSVTTVVAGVVPTLGVVLSVATVVVGGTGTGVVLGASVGTGT